MSRPLTYQYVKQWIINNTNYSLISTEYIKSKDKLKLKCEKHGIFEVSFDNLSSKKVKCKYCSSEKTSKKQRHSIEYIKNWINTKTPYILISNDYKNRRSKNKLYCKKHGIFEITFASLYRGHGCQKCGYVNTINSSTIYNIDKVKDFVEKNTKYKVISTEYSSIKDKMIFQCPDHGIFEASFDSIKVGKRCKRCAFFESRSEKECREIIESITNKKFLKTRPNFLKNPKTGNNLELDGYCEELKMAFEYDGEYHFKVVTCWNNYSNRLAETQFRDKLKEDLCNQYNIILIRIPYFIDDKKLFIKEKLQFLGYNNG